LLDRTPEKRIVAEVPEPLFTESGRLQIKLGEWRPFIGRPSTSRAFTLAPIAAELVSRQLSAGGDINCCAIPVAAQSWQE